MRHDTICNATKNAAADSGSSMSGQRHRVAECFSHQVNDFFGSLSFRDE